MGDKIQIVAANYDKHTKIWSGPTVAPLHNIEHHSVGKILYSQMRIHPNNVILIDDHDGTRVTNREALTWAIRIALHLKKQRMRHDDVVGLAARNTTYVTSVALGCFFNGTPFHAVNPDFHDASIAHCFGITKPEIIFCDGSDYEKILGATKSFQPIIYTVSEHIEGVPSVLDIIKLTKEELFYQPETLVLGADQTVGILCSSGTTGLPKAVTISAHKLMFDNPMITSDDVLFTTSGYDWMSGFMISLFNCYLSCTRILTRRKFSPEYFIELVQKYKITNVTMSPMHLGALVECPQFTTESVGTLKLLQCGGGSISKQVLAKAQAVLPRSLICFGYGLTEAGGISGYFGLERGNSVGKLVPNIRLRIVDEGNKNLEPNEIGEILVQYPYRWSGYYGKPLETQRILDSQGWFHTGDLGYMDKDGFLFIVDRKKEICKYMGQHYWPSEIESVIRELPDIIDCCVVGIPDDIRGDVAAALVIKSKGSEITEQSVVDHVRVRLVEAHKQLHNGVLFIDELPYNHNGKLLKREAKDMYKNNIERSKNPFLNKSK